MEYLPFPFDPGWPSQPLDQASAKARLEEMRDIMDERIRILMQVMGIYQNFKDLYGTYDHRLITALERWFAGRILSVEGGVVHMAIEGRDRKEVPFGPVYTLTPMAKSICADAGLLYARVLMHNCSEYKWIVHDWKHGPPEIMISNNRSRHRFSPWGAMFGHIVAIVALRECCPMIRGYASSLEMPPLR